MYKNGDLVVYGASGVCKVDGIIERDFGAKMMEYYVLKPIFAQTTTIYAPKETIGSQSNIRAVMTDTDANKIIADFCEYDDEWIINDIERKASFRSVMKNTSTENLARMIKTIYIHRKALSSASKHLHSYDEEMLKNAEKLLFNELAFALNTSFEDINAQIKSKI